MSTLEDENKISKMTSIKFPLTPDDAVRVLSPYLWEFERNEILEYDMIYFFNINERKKTRASV
jgi:hypothetical protein